MLFPARPFSRAANGRGTPLTNEVDPFVLGNHGVTSREAGVYGVVGVVALREGLLWGGGQYVCKGSAVGWRRTRRIRAIQGKARTNLVRICFARTSGITIIAGVPSRKAQSGRAGPDGPLTLQRGRGVVQALRGGEVTGRVKEGGHSPASGRSRGRGSTGGEGAIGDTRRRK